MANRDARFRTTMDDPTRAHRHMLVADSRDPFGNHLPALFNPEQLSLSIGADIAKLKPIGWSSPVKMYSSTGDWTFPISLHFSQFGIWARDYKYPAISHAVDWLSQFVYPVKLGRAPAKLIILWPNVMSIQAVLEQLTIAHTVFDKDLQVRMTEVSLSLAEINTAFIDAERQALSGFHRLPAAENIGGPTGPSSGQTGAPLNLGRGRYSK